MKTVYLIETFEELCHAFSGVRNAEDKTPMMESGVILHCNFGDLELKGTGSKLFVIADELKPKAKEFLWFLMTSPHQISERRLIIDEKFET